MATGLFDVFRVPSENRGHVRAVRGEVTCPRFSRSVQAPRSLWPNTRQQNSLTAGRLEERTTS
jgi:hypothetical protein